MTLAAGSIKNSTEHSDDALARAARGELPFTVQLDSPDPQVLILHTHATETYQTWEEPVYDPDFAARTADTSLNMCAVGARMAQVLNEGRRQHAARHHPPRLAQLHRELRPQRRHGPGPTWNDTPASR